MEMASTIECQDNLLGITYSYVFIGPGAIANNEIKPEARIM